MNITQHDVIVVIVTAVLVCLALSFFYERELAKLNKIIKDLKIAHLDRTFDWLTARQMAADWRDRSFSFSDALHRHLGHEDSMDQHLATLFDEELMKGNQD